MEKFLVLQNFIKRKKLKDKLQFHFHPMSIFKEAKGMLLCILEMIIYITVQKNN